MSSNATLLNNTLDNTLVNNLDNTLDNTLNANLDNTLVNTLNANLETTPDNTPNNTPDNTLNANLDNTPDYTSLHPNPFSKLPLKFQKYLAFAFWLSNHFKDNGFLNNDIPFHLILSSFKSFDSSSAQLFFFNHFDNLLLYPSLYSLSSYGKPTVSPYAPSLHDETSVKGKKQRKSAKKTNNDNVDDATADPATTEEKPKKQRKSAKTKEPVDPVADPATTEEKPKKQRKSAKKTNDNNIDGTADPTATTEEKPKKQRKSTKNATTNADVDGAVDVTTEKKQRKSKKSKEQEIEPSAKKSDLIHELLTLANNAEPITEAEAEPETINA